MWYPAVKKIIKKKERGTEEEEEEEEVKKVTLVQAVRRCTGRMAHSGSRGIALPYHDHGTRRG